MIKDDFFTYQAQTTPHPLALEIDYAKGSYIYDTSGKKYLDFVAGISACSLGHQHPKVVTALKKQIDQYLHVMVYGEYAQKPSVILAKLLANHLPKSLQKTYLVNSGTEAIEGAMKLAKRATGRKQIIAAKNAYHGNTQGSMSLMSYTDRKEKFEPLLPNIDYITYNQEIELDKITEKTAGVILETIQGGAGFIEPKNDYLKKVQLRCKEVGALFILDEIQSGFGRTGKLFGFENYNCTPDILVMGKGMGGGMPIGAFSASEDNMNLLQDNPKLGHITTFGGHPVIAAAALATLQEITEGNLISETIRKEKLLRKHLQHPSIKEIRGKGLMLALLMDTPEICNEVILKCQENGLILFWLLFEPKAIRITPPLTISDEEIIKGCEVIIRVLDCMNS